MAKLKLGAVEDDKPVRLTIELPAGLHRDLVAYAQALARETARETLEPAKPQVKRLRSARGSVRPKL